jgi:hypothetical protein
MALRSLVADADEEETKAWPHAGLPRSLGCDAPRAAVTCVIPGIGDVDHMLDNAAAGATAGPDASF